MPVISWKIKKMFRKIMINFLLHIFSYLSSLSKSSVKKNIAKSKPIFTGIYNLPKFMKLSKKKYLLHHSSLAVKNNYATTPGF
jgi:hypothetical protein